MSEDMVKDGYEEIVNVDISTVAIDMMRRKYEHVPQLKCIVAEELFNSDLETNLEFWCIKFSLWNWTDMQMDVRDMSVFPDESFDAVIDKGNYISLFHVPFVNYLLVADYLFFSIFWSFLG